jgi:natural product biosynthesis luciferase-like monooxygenase protein
VVTECPGVKVGIEPRHRNPVVAAATERGPRHRMTPIPKLSLFFFAADSGTAEPDKYKLLIESSMFADRHDFSAIWTPERHFKTFGGLYPNPSITTAAVAALTKRIQLRAGSLVLPLHNPIRVAEEWAVIDNISHGRVGIAIATGWHIDDFVLNPHVFDSRHESLLENVDIVRRLWRGESISLPNGGGMPIDVRILPRPIQPDIPIWLTTGSDVGFEEAGKYGYNILTANFSHNHRLRELGRRIDLYRATMSKYHGRTGSVTLMAHTYIGSARSVNRVVRPAMRRYIEDNISLKLSQEVMRPSKTYSTKTPQSLNCVVDYQLELNCCGGLSFIGSVDRCRQQAQDFAAVGVDEIACLIELGIPVDEAMASVKALAELTP